MRRGLWLALFLGSCSGLEPQPIDPARTEADFRARTLTDAGLVDYLRAHRVEPGPEWTFDALTLAAFYYHPDLDVARARLRGAKAGESTARTVPNPTLGANLEKVTNAAAGVSPWVYGFDLQMPLDFLWKRGWQIDEAKAKAEGSRLELGEAAWRVRRRLRASLLDHFLVRRELGLRLQEIEYREDLVAAATRLLAAGEGSRLEVDRARGELAAARIAAEDARGRVAASDAALAAAIGVPAAAVKELRLGWPTFENPPAEDALRLPAIQQIGLVNRLDIRRALAEYAASEAALGLELAKRYPDVTLGPGYLFDQGDKKFTIGLSISLPIFNQNGGPIAEAEARREEAAARFLAIQAQAIADFEQAIARYRAGLSQINAGRDAWIAVSNRESAAKRAVELGEADRATLVGVRIEMLIVAEARFDALRRAHEALGALEDAVQHPLDSGLPNLELPVTVPRQEKKP